LEGSNVGKYKSDTLCDTGANTFVILDDPIGKRSNRDKGLDDVLGVCDELACSVRIEENDGLLIPIPGTMPVTRGTDFSGRMDVVRDNIGFTKVLDRSSWWAICCEVEVKELVKVDIGVGNDISPQRHREVRALMACEDFALDESGVACIIFLELSSELPNVDGSHGTGGGFVKRDESEINPLCSIVRVDVVIPPSLSAQTAFISGVHVVILLLDLVELSHRVPCCLVVLFLGIFQWVDV
jgi:hypothetical protein